MYRYVESYCHLLLGVASVVLFHQLLQVLQRYVHKGLLCTAGKIR
jgi:hypothetical protein